ncbi:PREDICTED: translation initiation factor IF-2-like isoform X2 [Chinchilla lanigera]|uniref:translation initiation factor IF-2-like isoform X2 n=1 Tax=Chinchilla lanigera TaxID=34839 RepID=UPI00038EEEAC|nr:PREDICTED: translation initiation factor IF-2-like isoform X2 [Chinchilla lanigera]
MVGGGSADAGAPGAAMVAGSRWQPRAGVEARDPDLSRGGVAGGRSAPSLAGSVGPGAGRAAGGPTGRGARAAPSSCQARTPGVGSERSAAEPPEALLVWTPSPARGASVTPARRGLAPSPPPPWAAGSFVPAPRCPLFLPSAGRRGRAELGSGCPDVSALSDCGPGQSRAGVCGAGLAAARRGEEGLGVSLALRGADHSLFYERNRWKGQRRIWGMGHRMCTFSQLF